MKYIEFDMTKPIDFIPIGRIAIDFNPTDMYMPLSESSNFNKYVGGSPANIAVGLARLGCKVGFIGCVSDDQFGDFVVNYFDKDGNSEIEMEIPNIKNDNNSQSQTNENVNEDVNQLTQNILDKFYAEENSENHLSIKVKSDVIENNKYWFTLKLTISELAASSDLKYKYYNIDKRTDEIVKL